MAVYEEGYAPFDGASRAGFMVNFAGAALSLTLIVGVSFWGYKLIMRDVSGIPVVRAMEGDMRVLPDSPGGDVALHTGLAVNAVAAVGEAAAPEDRLVLAPQTAGLAQEDLAAQPMAEAGEVQPIARDDAVVPAVLRDANAVQADAAPLNADEILALADQIAAGIAPLAPLAETPTIIAASVPGVALSLRPAPRPANLVIAAPAAAPATSNTEVAVTTTPLAAGTALVQLGAFLSPELAATEWARLSGRFGALLADKDRVIQVSTHSGTTWYRLRATGFADRADARRFCVALEVEGAKCIAVTVS